MAPVLGVEEQVRRSLEALGALSNFEARGARSGRSSDAGPGGRAPRRSLVAGSALARPSQAVALLDQAFAARSAVLEARERAGIAGCTLLAMTGVPPERLPRQQPVKAFRWDVVPGLLLPSRK